MTTIRPIREDVLTMETDEMMRAAGITRSQLGRWRRAGVVTARFRVGDELLSQAEASQRYPASALHPIFDPADVPVLQLVLKLTLAGMMAAPAGRLARALVGRPGAPVLLAPGLVVRASVCDCPEDCDPFRLDVLTAQADLRPVVTL